MLTSGLIPTVPPKTAPVPVVLVSPVAKTPPSAPKVELMAVWRVKAHHVLAALIKLEIWVEPHTPLKTWQVEAVRAHMHDAYIAGMYLAPQK